jgi:post-segregation antitoxin (ccd killing protein)
MKQKEETRGRPPLAPEDRKSERVSVRLTPEELACLTQDAKERDVDVSALICHALSKCNII